jgi:pilus assembly protein CpaC
MEQPFFPVRSVSTQLSIYNGATVVMGGLINETRLTIEDKIPFLGDLPYIGPFFSNTSHKRVEKELIILVTPYLVSPMDSDQRVCLPGEDILDPTDCEFYFLNRIEGRTGIPFRSTTAWDNPLGLHEKLIFERRATCGPFGYSN